MNNTYIATFKSIDKSKLMKKEEVIRFLEDNGAYEPTMAMLSEQYHESVGIDPIWRYPLSDDMHNGGFIVPVQEGCLWLPYDEVDQEYYEVILPEEARLLDAECCERFQKDLREYADSLCAVLKTIVEVSSGTEPVTPEISRSISGDQAILDVMTEHNFHSLRGTCDKYMIRGKLLCLLSDHCGVPTRL